MQVHARLVTPPDEKLVNRHLIRDFLERLLGVTDRERDEDGAGPRGNLVNIEPEPLGKKYDLGRNRWNGVVIVLAKKAKINLGESVDLGNTTELEDFLSRSLQGRMLGLVAGKFQAEICLDRGADIRGRARVNSPTAIFILMGKDVVGTLPKTFGITRAEQRVQQDVIGLESGIGFQLAAPVALFVLLGEEKLAGTVNSSCGAAGEIINFSEMQLRSRDRDCRGGFVHAKSLSLQWLQRAQRQSLPQFREAIRSGRFQA